MSSANEEKENLKTVEELKKAAENLDSLTNKLNDFADMLDNKAEEEVERKRLMNKILAKKTFGIIGWGFFALVVISIIAQQLSMTILKMMVKTGQGFPGIVAYLISFLPLYLVAFPIMFLIIGKLPKDNAAKTDIDIITLIKCFCMCITIMYVGNVIGTVLSTYIGGVFGKISSNNLAEIIMNTDVFSTMIFVVILGPVMEEIVFRKLLIDRIVQYGERNAMFLSALMFGLFHMNLFQFFYAFGIGLIFGYIYIKSRRVGYSIVFHMIINFMGSLVAIQVANNFGDDMVEKLLNGDAAVFSQTLSTELILSAIYIIIMLVIFILGLAFLIGSRKKIELDAGGTLFTRKEEKGVVYGNYGMAFFIAACLVMMVITTMAQLS
ncbi:MAG: lysostaphin resistance A-like protein [Catonella sp.]|uniref:CPBP family intramembrane glutamic endopeptidase n=1 Tax=Catonella sp. TaxID=2382125 RepID=UPI003F9FD0EE